MLRTISPLLAVLLAGHPFDLPHVREPTGSGPVSVAWVRDDGALLATMAQKDSAGIALGGLALSRGQSEGAKDLARVLVRDHTAHLKSVRALAAKLKVSVGPETQSADLQRDWDATFQGLSARNGDEFDTAFLDLVYEANAGGLEEVHTELLPAAQDPRVKQLLTSMTGLMGAHLATAKRLLAAKGN